MLKNTIDKPISEMSLDELNQVIPEMIKEFQAATTSSEPPKFYGYPENFYRYARRGGDVRKIEDREPSNNYVCISVKELIELKILQ